METLPIDCNVADANTNLKSKQAKDSLQQWITTLQWTLMSCKKCAGFSV